MRYWLPAKPGVVTLKSALALLAILFLALSAQTSFAQSGGVDGGGGGGKMVPDQDDGAILV